MFTGIVQKKAIISFVAHSPKFTHYGLELPRELLKGLCPGASVSVHGVCQTVVSINNNLVSFDAIEETLKRTNIKSFIKDQEVNVERAARIGDEVGGHLLSGHVMGEGKISLIDAPSQEQRILTIACDPTWMKYILPKGYIALNGVSLTVGQTDPHGSFSVHLIPETLRITTFGKAFEGEKINIEIDTQTQAIVDTVGSIMARNEAGK